MNGTVASRKFGHNMAALALTFCCTRAEAHLNATGMGPAYDGVLHFLTSPEDLVPAIAVVLLAGLRGAQFGRRAMFALPASWLAGIVLGATTAAVNTGLLWPSLWFVALGVLVVADAKLSLRAMAALCAVLGLGHGFLNGTGMGLSASAFVAALGLISAVFILSALVAALVVSVRVHWARMAVRVGGSWIAASGVLMLGWSLRGG